MLLQEEERLRKEEEERLRKEEEERLLREAEEKRLEEARLAELARKADEDRRKAEEEERLRKASEESEQNQVDINMAEDCEWSRLSPLSTSWFLLSFSSGARGGFGAAQSIGEPCSEQDSGKETFGSECG